MSFTLLLLSKQITAALVYTVPIPILAGKTEAFGSEPGSAFKVKMVSGILGPAMAVGAPLAGWLSSRYDRRGLLGIFALLAAVSGVAPVFLDSLDGIIATRFLLGLAAAALMTIGYTMPGDYLPEARRAGIFGLLSATSMVASVVSLPLSGWLGDSGWRLSFLIYMVPLFVAILALPQRLPPPLAVAGEGRKLARGWYRGIPWGMVALAFAIGIVLSIPGVYLSFHLAGIGASQASTIGLVMTFATVVSAISSIAYGTTVSALGQRVVFVATFAAMAAGLFGLSVAGNLVVAIATLMLAGVGMGWLGPNLMGRLSERVPDAGRGRIVGIVQCAMTIAPMFGIALLEPLLPAIGTSGALAAVAILSAVCACLFCLSPKEAVAK
ncbi:MFS transporter [Novosphingobium album (ex Hu et al. 2023)]|uniref:MFS transporter n=1 Tax=Novosphingobium album (ex Hu et al. 2023) TaxID=2930093 RepID=UPI001FB952FE|nr:MFS transporter [Novosphingobium album (ex Hu et al. 2023)]